MSMGIYKDDLDQFFKISEREEIKKPTYLLVYCQCGNIPIFAIFIYGFVQTNGDPY